MLRCGCWALRHTRGLDIHTCGRTYKRAWKLGRMTAGRDEARLLVCMYRRLLGGFGGNGCSLVTEDAGHWGQEHCSNLYPPSSFKMGILGSAGLCSSSQISPSVELTRTTKQALLAWERGRIWSPSGTGAGFVVVVCSTCCLVRSTDYVPYCKPSAIARSHHTPLGTMS